MALLFPSGYQLLDANGLPIASGTLTFYETTTTTPKAVYSDIDLQTAVSNPYSLDASGRIAVNLYSDGTYTILAKDSTGSTVWSRDDVFGWNDGTPRYDRTEAEIAKGVTPTDYSYEPANVLRYGADSTGIADSTAAFEAARDVLGDGNGTIIVPAGTFILDEFMLTTNSSGVYAIGIEGVFGGTYIRAAQKGKFAMCLYQTAQSGDVQAQTWWGPMIRNIAFDGQNPSDATSAGKRWGCGLYAPRECRLENVTFTRCLVGMVTGNNYYFGGRNINIRDCYVGVINGTYDAGYETITDLLDGSSVATDLVLPYAMTSTGHAGNKMWDVVRINTCEIGWAAVSRPGGGYTPASLMDKLTCEACTIGLLVSYGEFDLKDPWFEANDTSGTIDFNGVTYSAGCIVAQQDSVDTATTYGFGAVVDIDGGRIEKVIAGPKSVISITGDARVFNDPTIDAAGSVIIDRVRTDNVSLSTIAKRPSPLLRTGRSVCTLVEPKNQRLYGVVPFGGTLLGSDDFTGAALVSTKFSFTSALTYEQVGGIFAEQKYATISSADWGINLLISADLVADDYYSIYLMLRSDKALTFSAVNVSSFIAALGNQPSHPLNKWFGLGFVTRSPATTGTPRIRMVSSGAAQIDIGGIMVARFSGRGQAAEFMSGNSFYME